MLVDSSGSRKPPARPSATTFFSHARWRLPGRKRTGRGSPSAGVSRCSSSVAAAASTYAGIQAPLHSAAFGPELGTRVSLLAVDGVQKAELQLNPTDMGPVSVQIVVDGVLYTVQRPNVLIAADARTGRVFWQYAHAPAATARLCCGRVNRGGADGFGCAQHARAQPKFHALQPV
mgnify:CR=1 FL=1